MGSRPAWLFGFIAVAVACATSAERRGGSAGDRSDDRGSEGDADRDPDRDKDQDRDGERGDYALGGDYGRGGTSFSGAGRNESAPTVTFEGTAELNWQKGEEAFRDDDHLVAQRFYDYLRTKFPYSQFSSLAELRLGDCLFARERYVEAIDAYQNFARMHPTHAKVPFALYKTGLAYFEQIPGDWFLMPPSEEKDQAAVRDAERALKEYVERFPEHENIADGRRSLMEVRKKLLAHERYAADFYRGQGKDKAYIGRLEVIHRELGDVGIDAALLLEMTEVFVRLGRMDDARARVVELETKFPASSQLARARALVGAMPSARE